jgi:hypothetical protein
MAQERDTRPLGEIRFAADLPASDGVSREAVEANIRDLLHRIGVDVEQDIIDMGCTGLVQGLCSLAANELPEEYRGLALNAASFIRRHMAGSVCGLPCYVPRDRYCLVHDTIGGLQLAGNFDGPQAQRHPEALPFMSRELTEEERRKVAGIDAKLSADVKAAALAEYGATDLDDEPAGGTPTPSCPIPQPPFKCPEHAEPDWVCRKCIAQAIAEGKGAVLSEVEVWNEAALIVGHGLSVLEALDEMAADQLVRAELWVRVASWSKKVTRD